MIAKVKSYVDDLNADLSVLEGSRGHSSKYTLRDGEERGKLEISFEDDYFEGIACSLDSLSYRCCSAGPCFLYTFPPLTYVLVEGRSTKRSSTSRVKPNPSQSVGGKIRRVTAVDWTRTVADAVNPYSLPLVRDLQRAGFDLILIGFGLSTVYHGNNEYCLLSDMQDAIKILARTIDNVEAAL